MKRPSLPCCVRQSIAVTDSILLFQFVLKEFQGFCNVEYKQTYYLRRKHISYVYAEVVKSFRS